VTATRRLIVAVALVATLAASCAPPGSGSTQQGTAPQRAGGTKRITTTVLADPPALYYALIPAPIRPEVGGVLADFIHPGLTTVDHDGQMRPLLADAYPALENGLWTVHADGHMETTWKIRPNATWHDGAPLTASDLQFTLSVVRDRELPNLRNKNYDLIEGAETPDERTITVRWAQPYVDADKLFTISLAQPLPRHLLEASYSDAKASFLDLPYWHHDFVGSGPFRLKDWVPGSHLVLEAYDGYALGRARIDEIEAKFIRDGNTLVANILAGSVEVTLGKLLSLDQVLQVRDQWQHGTVQVASDAWVVVYPQHVNPNPTIVSNVQFRRALLHALDRQQMADQLMTGLVPIAHSVFNPGTPDDVATQAGIVRYDYDPRKATAMIEELGYTKGPDGVFRDVAGQRLLLETRGTASYDIHVKTLFPVVDGWQRIGVAAEPVVIPAQRASDLEEQATFPAFQVLWQPNGRSRLVALHSAEARLPERNFTGSNNGRYQNREFDALIDRYLSTVPLRERTQVATQIVQHMTDQLPVMSLFYNLWPAVVGNRLVNVPPLTGTDGARQAWNAHEWDVR
jgi:peptide/nickel transport system substrate-binding protein